MRQGLFCLAGFWCFIYILTYHPQTAIILVFAFLALCASALVFIVGYKDKR